MSYKNVVAVGTAITHSPPHRSVRAELPHTAPTSGHNVQPVNAIGDKDA